MAGTTHIDPSLSGYGSWPGISPSRMTVLAAALLEMFQAAACLPDPSSIIVFGVLNGRAHDHVSMQFDPAQPSERAVVEWAQRFGGTITGHVETADDGSRALWVKTEFPFGPLRAEAYTHIPLPDDGEAIAHADYPHEPGRLHGCPACEARCHCTPGDAQCVYDGPHDAPPF